MNSSKNEFEEKDTEVVYIKNKKTGEFEVYGNLSSRDIFDKTWPYGQYLLQSRDGGLSLKSIPPTYYPELEASLSIIQDAFTKAIADKKVSPQLQAKYSKLTKKQQEAWKQWKEAFKTDVVYLPSNQELAEAGVQAIRKYMIELIESRTLNENS
jgi:hypothetical protein